MTYVSEKQVNGNDARMIWQDIVIAGAQTLMIMALVPSIISESKPALPTSLMYTFLVFAITISLLSLGLWLSAITAAVNALEWLVLTIQKLKNR